MNGVTIQSASIKTQKNKKRLINLTTFQAFTVPIQDNEIVPGKKDDTICMWQHYLIQGQQQQVS